MNYRQLNAEERRVLAALRMFGLSRAEIARQSGRHRSTVGREWSATAPRMMAVTDRGGRIKRAHARRYRSRRNSQFGPADWARIETMLREEWNPEQVAG